MALSCVPLSDKHAPCMQCSLRSPPSPHSLRSPPRLCCSLAAHSSRSLRCPAAARLARVARRLACSVCSPRLPAVLASLAAACFCPARFACLLLLPRASLASALLTFTSPPPRLLLIHLAHLLCSLRSLLLASLAHCSLTARSLLAHCSRFARLTARLTPWFPCAMIALPPAVENCVVTVRNPYRTPTHTLFAPLYPFLSLTPPG